MIRTQLWNALAKQGLERIESVGKPFDPHLHHAIESVENAAHPEGVMRRGDAARLYVSRPCAASRDGPRISGAFELESRILISASIDYGRSLGASVFAVPI